MEKVEKQSKGYQQNLCFRSHPMAGNQEHISPKEASLPQELASLGKKPSWSRLPGTSVPFPSTRPWKQPFLWSNHSLSRDLGSGNHLKSDRSLSSKKYIQAACNMENLGAHVLAIKERLRKLGHISPTRILRQSLTIILTGTFSHLGNCLCSGAK